MYNLLLGIIRVFIRFKLHNLNAIFLLYLVIPLSNNEIYLF